jgi:hypothetical protein
MFFYYKYKWTYALCQAFWKVGKSGCVSFFCAACLLRDGGEEEARGARLTQREGVAQRVKKRDMQPEDFQKRWEEQGEVGRRWLSRQRKLEVQNTHAQPLSTFPSHQRCFAATLRVRWDEMSAGVSQSGEMRGGASRPHFKKPSTRFDIIHSLAFHTCTLPSIPPLAIYLPLGDHATACTAWPSPVCFVYV